MVELAIVKVSAFQGENKQDKNGKTNVYLTPIAGIVPNGGQVIAGTVAEQEGLIVGTTMQVLFTELEEDAEFGRQFRATSLGVIPQRDIPFMMKEIGPAQVIVTNPKDNTGSGLPVNNSKTADELKAERIAVLEAKLLTTNSKKVRESTQAELDTLRK